MPSRLKALICTAVLALATTSALAAATKVPAPAAAQSAVAGYETAVETQMQALVTTTLHDFFAHSRQPQPQHVVVTTHPDFDLSHPQPVIRQVAIDISMASDLPAEAIRAARQELAQVLRDNGYRFEAPRTAAEAQHPLAVLNVDVESPDRPEERNGLREYAMFATLILGAIACLVLAVNLFLIPWRRAPADRQTTKPSAARRQPQVNGPNPYGMTMATYAAAGPDVTTGSGVAPALDGLIGQRRDDDPRLSNAKQQEFGSRASSGQHDAYRSAAEASPQDWPQPAVKPSPHDWPAPTAKLPPLPPPAVLATLVQQGNPHAAPVLPPLRPLAETPLPNKAQRQPPEFVPSTRDPDLG